MKEVSFKTCISDQKVELICLLLIIFKSLLFLAQRKDYNLYTTI